MLTGVDFDEIIRLMRGASTSKQHLKKALDYYGIKYAPKSTGYDKNIPLPDICIIRMIYADENGVFKFKKELDFYDFFIMYRPNDTNVN